MKKILLCTILLTFACCVYAQTDNKTVLISAKDLYDGLTNKSLKLNPNQEIIVTGILADVGSSIGFSFSTETTSSYSHSYILIADKSKERAYVKAILADKKKEKEYKKGQKIKVRCRFLEEKDNLVVVEDTRNTQ